MSMYVPPSDPNDGDDQDTKFFDDEFDGEDIRASVLRRKQSNLLSRIVCLGVSISVVGAVATAVIFYEQHRPNHPHPSPTAHPTFSPTLFKTCWENATCPLYSPPNTVRADPVTGFTNYTGWVDSTSGELCCNICDEIFSWGATSTSSSTFDYLILDEIWLPQWCAALSQGHDPTLSHSVGTRCLDVFTSDVSTGAAYNRLSIHGLWPSLYDTSHFLSCCADSLIDRDTNLRTEADATFGRVSTVNPIVLEEWDIFPQLQVQWIDPTVNTSACLSSDSVFDAVIDSQKNESVSCSSCYLLNHEWQKHGSCFQEATVSTIAADAQYEYFSAALNLTSRLASQSEAMAAFAGQSVTVDQIQNLYPTQIQVLCDPQDSDPTSSSRSETNSAEAVSSSIWSLTWAKWMRPSQSSRKLAATQTFLEIRTCWNTTAPHTLIDCPAATTNAFSAPCSDTDPVFFRSFIQV